MIGIEGIDAVIFGRNEYNIMCTAGNLHVGYVQWLPVYKGINGKGVELSKSACIDIGGVQRRLV
jgi:hypothetical protein